MNYNNNNSTSHIGRNCSRCKLTTISFTLIENYKETSKFNSTEWIIRENFEIA